MARTHALVIEPDLVDSIWQDGTGLLKHSKSFFPNNHQTVILFEPLLSHQFSLVRFLYRIRRSRLYHLLSCLIIMAFVAIIAFNPFSSLVIVIPASSAVMFLLLCEWTLIDRNLMRCLLYRFNLWYVVCMIVVNFIAIMVGTLYQPRQLVRNISLGVVFSLVQLTTVFVDAMPLVNRWYKVAVTLCLLLNSFRVLVSNMVGWSSYEDTNICLIWCDGTRRIALATLFQIAIWNLKILLQASFRPEFFAYFDLQLGYHEHHAADLALRSRGAPFNQTLHSFSSTSPDISPRLSTTSSAPDSESEFDVWVTFDPQSPVALPHSEPLKHELIQRNLWPDALPEVQLEDNMELPSMRLSFNAQPLDRTMTRKPTEIVSDRILQCRFMHTPVIPVTSPLFVLNRAVHSKYYLFFCTIWVLSTAVLFVFSSSNAYLFGVALLISICLIVCELTRVDRLVLRRLAHCFDFVYLSGTIVLFVVVRGLMIPALESHEAIDIIAYVYRFSIFCLIGFYGLFMDAEIFAPQKLRTLYMIAFCANIVRTFVDDRLDRSGYLAVPVCVVYCTDTKQLAYSALFTILCFYAKYAIRSVRHPERFSLLLVPLKFRVISFRPTDQRNSMSALPLEQRIGSM